MFYPVALLAAGALAAPAPEAAPSPVPLNRAHHYEPRADGTVDGPAFLQSLNRTLQKYNHNALPSYGGAMEKRAVGQEKLTDQVTQGSDTLYYGPATVGNTSPQTFTIDFDTGSADFFVPGPKCTMQQGCVGTTKYDQGGQNEGNMTSVTYGSGAVKGNNYFDKTCVAGLCANRVNVISLTTAQGFANSASEGLMGMGFSTIANSKQPTFFERLMAQKKVTQNEFAFYLGRAKSNTQGNSEMTLGGTDKTRYTGTLSAPNPVTTKGYWQIALDSVKVGGRNTPATKGQAAIDTGTTIILAPTVAATAIFAQIPGAFPVPLASGSATMQIFAYPCNTKRIPQIVFGGKSYQINPLDFSLGQLTEGFASLIGSNALTNTLGKLVPSLSGGICLAAIAGADLQPAENLYVVGDSFLKNWYSVYNYNNGGSVSFAKADGNQ